MSEQNNAIRRQLGCDLIDAERRLHARHLPIEVPEQVAPVAIGVVKSEHLPSGTKYFTSFDDFLAWCDSEGGATD